MSLRVVTGVRRRLGQLLGHPQINLRLHQLEEQSTLRDLELRRLSDDLGALDARINDQISRAMLATLVAARDHSDRSVMEQQSHALTVAAGHAEAAITASQNQLVKDLREETRASIAEVQDGISAVGEYVDSSISDVGKKLLTQLAVLRRRVDAVDARGVIDKLDVSDTTDAAQPARDRPTPSVDPVISAEMYAALEDVFRGDELSVKQRQEEYLPLVSGAVDDEHPVLDLGCGRGEWLTALSEVGLRGIGVDSNLIFVNEVREHGLDVEHGDLVEYLRSAPDESAGAITLFQVLEHLPFATVVEVLTSAHRVLRPGGVLIAEVPNAKNLRVGAGTFWIDPTHERPWYPDVLEFLAQAIGFSEVDGLYVNRSLPAAEIVGVPHEVSATISRLAEAIDGPQDYALVARA